MSSDNLDWRSPRTFVGSLLRETAAERDQRLRRERTEAEARQEEQDREERQEFEEQMKRLQQQAAQEPSTAVVWSSRLPHGGSDSYIPDLEDMSRLGARCDQELEEQLAADYWEQEAVRENVRHQRLLLQRHALQEQAQNPLGLHYQDYSHPPAYRAPDTFTHASAPPAETKKKEVSSTLSPSPPDYDASPSHSHSSVGPPLVGHPPSFSSSFPPSSPSSSFPSFPSFPASPLHLIGSACSSSPRPAQTLLID
eukprot:m.211794 g.211794  ORF g.211794 m.211794 type:complete len:253 (+) comp16942_c5_seq1:220-978(+)